MTVSFRRKDETGAVVGMRSCGRYLDQWEKRGGRWAITRRELAYDHDEVREVTPMRGTQHATRDASDPSYAILKGLNP